MKSKPEILVLFFLLGFFLIFILIRSHYFYRSSQDTFTTFLHQNQSHAMETEPFESKSTEIDYYVITMKNPERIENINQQMDKLKQQGTPVHIEIVDAVKGIDLNLNELIKQETLSPNYQSGYGEAEKQKKKEIGCFMSHLKIHELIQQKQQKQTSKKYSVIFEDDFKITSEHFIKEIEDSLTSLEKTRPDFDLLYLGTNYENHGNVIEHHTYEIDKKNVLFGTHAILVNNAKIDNFIQNMKPIKQPIDVQYMELCKSDALNAYILFPILVTQQFDQIPSTITSENFNPNLSNLFQFESFQIIQEMDFYVITTKKRERMENINLQLNKLKTQGTPIHLEIINGVVGKDLDLTELINRKMVSPDFQSGYNSSTEKIKKKEIGCYLSHLQIYETIRKKTLKPQQKYSVIFEDDFDICSEHFIEDIQTTLTYLEKNQIDFDVLFLGTLTDNHGETVSKKIYKIDKSKKIYGTHAMIINHRNIHRVIEHLQFIKNPIDNRYTELCHSDKITAYVIYPHLVKQQIENLTSTITSENFHTLTVS